MRSILIACSQPTDDDPVVSFAADLAVRTGAVTSLAVVEGARPETILDQACEADADLVVLSPRIPPVSTAIELDHTATRIIFRCEPAVLVLRPPMPEIRRILIPVRRDDLRRGSLAPALEWAEWFCRAHRTTDTDPVEVHLLHVAQDPDEMYEDVHLLGEELQRLLAPGSAGVRRFQCVRWGAPPHMRIARWVARHGIDLVILRRHSSAAPSGSQDHAWFHALGVAGRPVLLLPLEGATRIASLVGEPAAEPAARGQILSPNYGHGGSVAAAGRVGS